MFKSRNKVLVTAIAIAVLPAAAVHAQVNERNAGGSQASEELVQFLTAKLMLANHSEIEMAQLAAQKASHAEVKQFAQTLVEEHQQLNQQLEQQFPQAAQTLKSWISAGDAGQQRRAESRAANEPASRGQGGLTDQLGQIMFRATQNHLQMTKQMLDNYQGQDFDMGFLGMQIGAHAWLLSELKAIDQVGSQEFQQIVNKATQATEQHLEEAKQLAKRFEDERRTATAQRPQARPERRQE